MLHLYIEKCLHVSTIRLVFVFIFAYFILSIVCRRTQEANEVKMHLLQNGIRSLYGEMNSAHIVMRE